MASQPDESPAMDVRNALTILSLAGWSPAEPPVGRVVAFAIEDIHAIRARLDSALTKLEADVAVLPADLGPSSAPREDRPLAGEPVA